MSKPSYSPLAIVGIGASAGGLAALRSLLQQVPQDSNLAFVIVIHLSPEHESHLAGLLQAHVSMPVRQVTGTTLIEPNQIYVIPPNCNLSAVDTHLRLSDLEEQRRERAPIDHFFRTLANTYDGNAIGVILTGTGTDGTLGIKEIKGRHGLTIAQDPNEAEYDGMPQSAIASGFVDLILPMSEMIPAILSFIRTQPRINMSDDGEEPDMEQGVFLQKIFAQVRARTGRDFSYYKRSTILRRIQRRMQLQQIETLEKYLEKLHDDLAETRALAEDFLINVTKFFRDPEVFQKLEKEIVPQIFREKEEGENIRVWSVGCATGEEAYSLAMLLLEEADSCKSSAYIQIFASDLQERSLQIARDGFYPEDIETEVSPERLRRFFQKEEGGYRVRKEVRELVVFAQHNFLSDPPFSKLDLISCRNVLIYLQREKQHDIIELFHYALLPERFLVLGTSETIDSPRLFRLESKPHSLYQKRKVANRDLKMPVFPITHSQSRLEGEPAEPTFDRRINGNLRQRMVELYAPPNILVDANFQVLHFSEQAGRYLVHSGGELSSNILKLIRVELQLELRAALKQALELGLPVRSAPQNVQIDGELKTITFQVKPAIHQELEGLFLIIFDENNVPVFLDREPGPGANPRELESELNLSRHRLRVFIEEYESSQVEMKAANEELQSMNEELRATMEELETSKEELQSMNEELSALNQENRHKVDELIQLSGDLQNLLSATNIATLFLDLELRIMRYTPRIGELFNIRLTDSGRPLADLTHRLGYQGLLEDAKQVLDTLQVINREIQGDQENWFIIQMLPYRSTENRIGGVVITFIDITERKKAEEALREREEHLQIILSSAREYAIFTTNPDRKITDWNTGAERIFGYSKAEVLGQSSDLVFVPEERDEAPVKEAEIAVKEGRAENERWHMRKNGGRFWASGLTMPLKDAQDQLRGFLSIMVDDTYRRQMEEDLRQAKEQAERAARAKTDFLAHMSHEIRTPLNVIIGLSMLLESDPREDQQESVELLKFSAQNLRTLIDDILDFSKIQAGQLSVQEKETNLRDLLRSLEKAHQLRARHQGIELSVKVDERIPSVIRTDELKLSQILNNLINNAIKFTLEGEVLVEVVLKSQEGEKLWLDFSIRDTGIGIPREKLDAIFDAFTQVDNSTVRNFEGTGLGLSITKSLLDLLGSRINVESIQNKGSRFYFTLPVGESKYSFSDIAAGGVFSENVDLSHLRVLLVEDVASNRTLFRKFLKAKWNIQVEEANNGKEALERVQSEPFDLILMDIRMPVMDGYEAAQLIRKLPDPLAAQTPIIALTADTFQEVKRYPEATLFSDLITKPFQVEDMLEKIIRHSRKSER